MMIIVVKFDIVVIVVMLMLLLIVLLLLDLVLIQWWRCVQVEAIMAIIADMPVDIDVNIERR